MSFPDHFSAMASEYAAARPRYPKELGWWLGSIAPARGVAWEAGCGSGQLSAVLGDVFARVEATDASAAQVAQATPHPHVHYRVAPAEASGLPDAAREGGIHLAVAAQAAHWFDLDAYYAEVRRVVRPGGAIALVAYMLPRVNEAVDAALDHLYRDVLDAYWPPQRRHIDTGYRDLPFPFTPIDAPTLEMTSDWTADALLGFVGTWSAMRALRQEAGAEAADREWRAFEKSLRSAWGDAGSLTVRWPLVVRAGHV